MFLVFVICKSRYKHNNWLLNIERIISIGENFYTISPEMIKVTNIVTMEEIKEGTYVFKKENELNYKKY